ncbi:methionine/alanine import family NSS transporter small subunit [Streptomyces sp. TRM 70351]|nr:methionine/alanine import family NSS transporter small subunit [Streptomyces sp. TRM 70351]MEE1928655.1 methionine/alanine import family NSS transporter small subunit [Streptomyces sp. TRM 70351]
MSTSAVVMMIVSMAVVWGGLLAAVLKLRGHPETEVPPESPEGHSV